MTPFTTLTAVAASHARPNVDTDQILPARFLKKPRSDGYDNYLFHDARLADDGGQDPDFFLNQPANREAKILVANLNFGCGSSREGAVYALADHGFRCVIAPSFGDIFHNNCFKNGVLPIRLDEATVADLRALIAAQPGTELTVDLEAQTVTMPSGESHAFEIDPFWKAALLEGLDELGLTLQQTGEIEAFEQAYYTEMDWLGSAGG
jgi:3-isopropylmalate/(R)-2-methylmalate dehydratase small subunit